jgi:hypothetical protein
MGVKHSCSIENDEKGNHIGKSNAEVDVSSNWLKLCRRLFGSAPERLFTRRGPLFPHFQRSLPEEKILTLRDLMGFTTLSSHQLLIGAQSSNLAAVNRFIRHLGSLLAD